MKMIFKTIGYPALFPILRRRSFAPSQSRIFSSSPLLLIALATSSSYKASASWIFATAHRSFGTRQSMPSALRSTPNAEMLPPGMDAVHVGVDLEATALREIERLGVSKCFVVANRSSGSLIEHFLASLQERGLLAAPLNCGVVMGGAEDGLLQACDEAAAASADCVITVGGGAVQDAGKLIRLWLSAADSAGG